MSGASERTASLFTRSSQSDRSPLSGLGALDRSTLYILGVLSVLKAATLIGIATALASAIVGVIDNNPRWDQLLGLGVASVLTRAAVIWAHRVVSARALLGAKERLRAELADALVAGEVTSDFGSCRSSATAGSDALLATSGLDELDKYYTVFLPSLVNAAVIPLVVGARILCADWVSALVIVLTVPLVPMFMTLIGLHTRQNVAAISDSLATLSNHLVELARGLPVLVGLGRAQEQAAALRRISETHREKAVQALRTAFLSSLALEIIATISVAVVAVFIGIRLVAGELTLEAGLIVLLLAPECFSPLRDIGTAFHAAEDGREALERGRQIINAPRSHSLVTGSASTVSTHLTATATAPTVTVSGLTVRFSDRSADAVNLLDCVAPGGVMTVIDGESGAGKSTVLGVLAGVVRDSPLSRVRGSVSGFRSGEVAWLPQHPQVMNGTVYQELELYSTGVADVTAVVGTVLEQLRLTPLSGSVTATLSQGELRRLAFCRVLLRVEAGASVVLLDEPTAQLDATNAALIVVAIRRLRGRATVIVASHDSAIQQLADHTVLIGTRAAASVGRRDLAQGPPVPAPPFGARLEHAASLPPVSYPPGSALQTVRDLAGFFRPQAGQVFAAVLLGTGATLATIALAALSGWLIVRASEQPPIMYLLVAIVGVRFLGISRAVLRYSERLLTHSAVLAAVTELRLSLWNSLASRGVTARAMLRGGNTLDHLVSDVDRVRDLSIRVVIPVLTGTVSIIVAAVGLWLIFPPALPLLIALLATGAIVAPIVAVLSDRSASRAGLQIRSSMLQRFTAMLGARDDLRVNGVDVRVRSELRKSDAAAGRAARRSAFALGLGNAVVIAACGLTAMLMLPATVGAVASGSLRPELVAVLVLTPCALIDPFLDLVAAFQNFPALRQVLARVGRNQHMSKQVPAPDFAEASAAMLGAIGSGVTSLTLDDVSAIWPGQQRPVFQHVSASVGSGEWLVLTGASGSGKSTILAVLLGQLDLLTGSYFVNQRLQTGRLPARSGLGVDFGWCPQEGHLFNSTLRANLLLARPRSNAPDDEEMLGVLQLVGLSPLLDRLTNGLDTVIGSSGDALSGGERQRIAVARTLLTRADVILIDEPTAHLDLESARQLMDDLRVALHDRITVLVTHQAIDLRPEDKRIDLDAERPVCHCRPTTDIAPTAISGTHVGSPA